MTVVILMSNFYYIVNIEYWKESNGVILKQYIIIFEKRGLHSFEALSGRNDVDIEMTYFGQFTWHNEVQYKGVYWEERA